MNTGRYSVLQAGFYISMDALMGFSSFYLMSVGCSNFFIGIVFALAAFCSIFVQLKGGSLADSSKHVTRFGLILLFSGLTILCAIVLLLGVHQAVAAGILFLFMMILNFSLTPFINALGMYYTNQGDRINFGITRGVGSLAYTIASVLIGYLADDSRLGPSFVPASILIGSATIVLILLTAGDRAKEKKTVPENPSAGLVEQAGISEREVSAAAGKEIAGSRKALNRTGGRSGKNEKPGLMDFIRRYPRFLLLTCGITLLFIFHNILGNYAIQIITPLGGGSSETGLIAALAAVGEVPVMCLFTRIMRRFSPGSLIRFSSVFFTLRGILLMLSFFVGSLSLYCAMSATQVLGYAIFIPASVYYANEVIEEEYLTLGQSFMSITNTPGIVIGSLIGGTMLDLAGVLPLLVTGCVISITGTAAVFMTAGTKGRKRA